MNDTVVLKQACDIQQYRFVCVGVLPVHLKTLALIMCKSFHLRISWDPSLLNIIYVHRAFICVCVRVSLSFHSKLNLDLALM